MSRTKQRTQRNSAQRKQRKAAKRRQIMAARNRGTRETPRNQRQTIASRQPVVQFTPRILNIADYIARREQQRQKVVA